MPGQPANFHVYICAHTIALFEIHLAFTLLFLACTIPAINFNTHALNEWGDGYIGRSPALLIRFIYPLNNVKVWEALLNHHVSPLNIQTR